MDIKKLARKNIIALKPYTPGKPIEEVKRELGIEDVYKLASNENSLGPSPLALKAIKENLSFLHRYPDSGCYYLKQKLAQKFALKPSNFIVANGSDEIIVLTLRAFLNPGEEVITAKPTFLIYEIASKIAQAKLKLVPLKKFRYDLKTIARRVTAKTKIIFIANPDNPTGTYLTQEEVEEFLTKVPSHVIIYFDEAYFEYVSVKDFPDTVKFINKRPLIVTRSFSKAYGLAGIRIGYGIAQEQIISYLDKVREPFNVNSLAQVAALSALDDEQFIKRSQKYLLREKQYLYRALNNLGLNYIPSMTNFIMIQLRDAKKIADELLRRGIIVRYLGAWGLNNCIRVTIGKRNENKKFLSELSHLLRSSKETTLDNKR